jgi:hypothetical protein
MTFPEWARTFLVRRSGVLLDHRRDETQRQPSVAESLVPTPACRGSFATSDDIP